MQRLDHPDLKAPSDQKRTLFGLTNSGSKHTVGLSALRTNTLETIEVGPAPPLSQPELHSNANSSTSRHHALGDVEVFTQMWMSGLSSGVNEAPPSGALKSLALSDAQHPRYYLPVSQVREQVT
jgi:hypothetical protein